MKNSVTVILAVVLVGGGLMFMGAGCSSNKAPLTEEQQAAENNMSLQEYRDMKSSAARMNMPAEKHMQMDK
ncbi:MAG: hypothetical protein COU30_04110 [Candidatus Magasanikbacteria bacterium CG10_big_fil_rev_8_21_14_0_10_38_6]|uniref:Uncharacterized protein n=1 Tax=Candidatus Magasanikbacteria bacterium CG10_big_fil_rev_8_21_14_0_10_38_6 TaxID=1974647 RepID=A0A2M6P078_9BACT|nr:MAG: hypothetical protein COU30_04110 [Candidatus Magasanikbacteria bacterium CG10_big_fil_rev_8_21_14_0_10_38_6]